jgi:hypothetical protein
MTKHKQQGKTKLFLKFEVLMPVKASVLVFGVVMFKRNATDYKSTWHSNLEDQH